MPRDGLTYSGRQQVTSVATERIMIGADCTDGRTEIVQVMHDVGRSANSVLLVAAGLIVPLPLIIVLGKPMLTTPIGPATAI